MKNRQPLRTPSNEDIRKECRSTGSAARILQALYVDSGIPHNKKRYSHYNSKKEFGNVQVGELAFLDIYIQEICQLFNDDGKN